MYIIMSSVQLLRSNNGGRRIREDRVSNGRPPANVFSYPSASPDHCHQPNTRAAKNMQWYTGLLHIIHQVANIFMTIHLQIGVWGHSTTSEIEVIKVDNNGIHPSPNLDEGVACACRICSLYDICKTKCPATADRSGAGLPILCESDEERKLEVTNIHVKRHVDAIRSKRVADTRQIYKRYKSLLKQITHNLSQLIKEKKLPYNRLKGWVYILRPLLKAEMKEKEPPVDKMLNSFYQHWFSTVCLWNLIMKVEEFIKEPLPVVKALETFEGEVDRYFSNRMYLHGNGSNGEPKALLCLDPEWSHYLASELYQLQNRAREALQRIGGQTFTVYFCTPLKEYVLLRHVEIFVHKMKEVITKDARGESIVEDDDLVIPHSTDVVFVDGPSAFVNPSCKIAVAPPRVGCGCSQLDHAATATHKCAMPESNKYFTCNYGT